MDNLANNVNDFFRTYSANEQLESSPEVQALFGPLILAG